MRNRTATINNAYLHAKHNATAMARPKQEKSEARWRDYAADNYFHYYYRYGEDEEGAPLADGHRHDDLLELAAEAVKSLTSFKHYEGGKTTRGVGDEVGFAFTRRHLGCYCVPAAGASCCHAGWTGDLDRGVVTPARTGNARRVAPQAARRSGPPLAFRQGIKQGSLLCMPGDEDDEDDETADGLSIWFVNALGPQARYASRRRTRSDALPDTRSAATRTTIAPPHAHRTGVRRRRTQRRCSAAPARSPRTTSVCPSSGWTSSSSPTSTRSSRSGRRSRTASRPRTSWACPTSSGSRWRGTNTSCRASSTIYATTSSDERRLSRELFTRVSHSMVYRVVEK